MKYHYSVNEGPNVDLTFNIHVHSYSAAGGEE